MGQGVRSCPRSRSRGKNDSSGHGEESRCRPFSFIANKIDGIATECGRRGRWETGRSEFQKRPANSESQTNDSPGIEKHKLNKAQESVAAKEPAAIQHTV